MGHRPDRTRLSGRDPVRDEGVDGLTLQNRVLPTGEIVADAAYRGMLMGNRGILHDAQRRLGRARWRHKAWVCCALSFKGRHRTVMTAGRYTELFFLDEAVALSAGHRPCAECRRADFTRFQQAWADTHGQPIRAPMMDAALHCARVTRGRRQVRHVARWSDLPDGSFAFERQDACLVLGDALYPFSPSGYGPPRVRPMIGSTEVCTPAPTIDVLRAGYRPRLHPDLDHG